MMDRLKFDSLITVAWCGQETSGPKLGGGVVLVVFTRKVASLTNPVKDLILVSPVIQIDSDRVVGVCLSTLPLFQMC